MPNPHNPNEDKHDDFDKREKTMKQNEWLVDISSYAQLGLVIGSFNNKIGNENFIGTAEMKVDGPIRTLEIMLCFDETELYRCGDCSRVPSNAGPKDPVICTFCGQRVCNVCWKRHEQKHWRPQRTIGGEKIPF